MPGFAILPYVLEGPGARRHKLPYGKRDRPIYEEASQRVLPERVLPAKGRGGLVPLDVPGGEGLWPFAVRRYSAASGSRRRRSGS